MSNKGKKDPDYHVGSLVFAKLKGFAPWPAKIVKAEKKKFYVYFYGTGEKSPAMKSEDLFDYAKNKTKFVVDKNLKRKSYPEAVDQIEAALRGETDAASIMEDIAAVNESLTTETHEKSLLEDAVVPEHKPEAEDDANKSNLDATPAPDSTVLEETSSTEKKAAPKKPTKTPKAQAAPQPPPPPPELKSEAEPEPEIVSRSGRKIKTKRYLIDEIDETVTPTIKKRAVDSMDSRKSVDSSENTPKRAKPVAVPVPVVATSPPVVVQQPQKEKEKPNPEKDSLLQVESHMVELDHLIKMSLGLKTANADKCLELLNEYATLQITPLMLKKRPNCVHTMKRLRKYVGNVNNWNMEEEKRDEFHEKTIKIQTKANEIYSNFKILFPHHELKTFWDHFSEKVKEFQDTTKGMTPEEVVDMYVEPELTTPTSPPPLEHEKNGNMDVVAALE